MNTNFTKSHHEQVLREWLSEFKSLPKSSLPDYAKNVHEKTEVMASLKVALTSVNNQALIEILQPACHQLFEFYRSRYDELRMFAIGLFPAMIGAYLLICSSRNAAACQCKLSLGAYLLSIYNLLCGEKEEVETLDSEGGIEIPNIATPSVYHDPMAYPFSERTLNMRNPSRTFANKLTTTAYSSIIPSNRCKIMNVIMSTYANQIGIVSNCSHQQLCNICTELACIGFPWQRLFLNVERSNDDHRVSLDYNLTLTILRCVYYTLYNGCRADAIKATQSMQKRAKYEICPQVLLLCNAVLNSVYHEKGKLNTESALGLSAALTPIMSRSSSKVLRHVVTAKSIKHHKWHHTSEEVSGDITDSLQQEDSGIIDTSIPSLSTELDDQREKHTASPSKLLKAKLKKSVPTPTASVQGDKALKNTTSSSSDKKNKKKLPTIKSLEDQDDDYTRARTPSGTSTEPRESPNHKSKRFSSTSVPSLKQLTSDEQTGLLGQNIGGSSSLSKSVNDFDGPIIKVSEPSTPKRRDSNSPNFTFSKKNRSDKAKKEKKLPKEPEAKEVRKNSTKKKEAQIDTQEALPLLDTQNTQHSNAGDETTTTRM